MRPVGGYVKASFIPTTPMPTSDRKRYKSRKGGQSVNKLDQLKKTSGMTDYTNIAYREAVGKLKSMLTDSYCSTPKYLTQRRFEDSDEEDHLTGFSSDQRFSKPSSAIRRPFSRYLTAKPSSVSDSGVAAPSSAPPELVTFIERQEDYIEQLEKESQYCRDELSQLLLKVKDLISENEALHSQKSPKTVDVYSDKRYDYNVSSVADDKFFRPIADQPHIVYESRITELEAQLTQIRLELKTAQEEANIYKRRAVENDPTSSSSEFYKQVESLHREKRELSDSLCKLQSAVAQLREKESDCSRKVLRTQDVAEKAQMDKQQAEMEVQRLKSELDHQHQRLLDVLSEQTRKISEERSQAERRYLQHVEQLNGELATQRDLASKLQLELERHYRVEDDLRRDLTAKNSTADSLRKELTAKIVSLQNELASALSERDVLEQELSSNRMSGERSERVCRQEATRLQVEVNALRQRVDKSDQELTQARRDNLGLSEQISTLESEIMIYKTRVGEIEADGDLKRASTVRELEGLVQKQAQTMANLSQQCHTLTYKLDDSANRHKQEMAQLQNSLEFLTSRLESSMSARQWPQEPEQARAPHYESQPPHFDDGSRDTVFTENPENFHAEVPRTPQKNDVGDNRFEETVENPVPPERPISRASSRADRTESPLKKAPRKNPLFRRESRMKIDRQEYEPPKQQFAKFQPQNALVEEQNDATNYGEGDQRARNFSGELSGYQERTNEVPQEQRYSRQPGNYAESDPRQYDMNQSYPQRVDPTQEHRYSTDGSVPYEGETDQARTDYGYEQPQYGMQETYPSDSNYQPSEPQYAPQAQYQENFRPPVAREPSRESLRSRQEPEYQREAYRPPDDQRTPDPIVQEQYPVEDYSRGQYEEVPKYVEEPKPSYQNLPKQGSFSRQEGQEEVAKPQEPYDPPKIAKTVQQSAIARQAANKMMQKAQRNAPTRIQQ